MELSRNSCPSIKSLSTMRKARLPFSLCCLCTGYSLLRRLFISLGNWSLRQNLVPFKLPSSALDQLLLLVVLKFGDDRSGTLGLVAPSSKSVYSLESHLVYSLYRKFNGGLHEFSDRALWIIGCILRNPRKQYIFTHATTSRDSFITLFFLSRQSMLESWIFTLATC